MAAFYGSPKVPRLAHLPSYSVDVEAGTFPEAKHLWCEADPPSAEVSNEWNCASVPLYALVVDTGTDLHLNFRPHLSTFVHRAKRDKVTGERRSYINRGLCSVLLTKYYSTDQIKKTEMGRACSMCAGEERCIQGFGGES
jgi:hypothetical protein